MRISGGQFKGKEIISKKQRDTHIRPTSGKVREAIFNILEHGKFRSEIEFLNDDDNDSLLEDRVIADIYSGTGILGFEALSRGARTVCFVDQSDESLRLSKQTADRFKVMEKCIFERCNATNLPHPPIKADLIFMDPPYEKGLVMPCLQSIHSKQWLRENGVVLVEHSKKENFFDISHFKILDSRPYNNTVVTILKMV